MHWRVVQRVFGIFLMLFSIALLVPIGIAFWANDGQQGPLLTAWAITFLAGIVFWLPARRAKAELQTREGFVIVVLFWFALSLIGTLPFVMGTNLSFTDALFESTSGFTTTGGTVIVGIDQLPISILYYRQQLQWLGGMGVIILAVAIIPMLGVGGMQLYQAEAPGPVKNNKLTPRINQTARILWSSYLVLTIACAVSYWFAGMTPFEALVHSFTTVSTGGFSTHDQSLAYYDSVAIEMVANVFMLLGAISFAMHFTAWKHRDPRMYWQDPETRTFVMLVAAASLIITVTLWLLQRYGTFWDALRYAVFQVISVITGTGFTTADFSGWPTFMPILLIAISFIGGCAGSTAGGMKVIRVMLLFKQGVRELDRLIHPRAQLPVKIGNRPMPYGVIEAVWGFFALYMLSTLVLTLVMIGTGLEPVSAFSAVAASINVLGPGLNQVASNFTYVSDFGKWVLSFTMVLGRLELFTLLVILSPRFWRR